MSRANAGAIRNGTPEQVHVLLDRIAGGLDENAAKFAELEAKAAAGEAINEELKTALDKQNDVLKDVEERLRLLDKNLEQGDKLYRPILGNEQEGQAVREDFAKTVLDIAAKSVGQRPRFGSSVFLSQTEVTTVGGDSGDVLGGYLVPDAQRNEIIRIVYRYGVARRICKVLPMGGKTLRLPTNSDLPDTYWDTELATRELAAPSESKITIARPELSAHKLIAIDTLSIELDQDSVPSMAGFLMDLFGIAVAKEEDYQCLVSPGTGNEPFTGLLAESGIAEVTGSANTYLGTLRATGDDGGYNKVVETMDSADEDAVDNGIWVMSNSIVNAMRQVKDAEEQPLFGLFTNSAPGTLLGRPYVRSRIMPKTSDSGGGQAGTPFLIFGNFDYRILGDRMQLSIDVSPHAKFAEAGLMMRVMERIAYVTALKAPFARLQAST